MKDDSGLTKKEIVGIQRQRNKLEASLGGIKDMSGVPDALFVIDTNMAWVAIGNPCYTPTKSESSLLKNLLEDKFTSCFSFSMILPMNLNRIKPIFNNIS